MDANVKALVDTVGCTPAEAQTALKESEEDFVKALDALDATNKEVIVFNVQFVSKDKAEGKGYLTAVLDLARDNVVFSDMVYPLSGDKADMLDTNMPPTVFAKTLGSAKKNINERHRGTSSTNLALIRAKMGSSFIRKAIDFHNKAQIEQINQLFAGVIGEAYGKEFSVQYFARSQALGSIAALLRPTVQASAGVKDAASKLFGEAKEEHPEPAFSTDDIQSTSPQDPIPQLVLICEPEISPFHGKPLRELVESDEIIVKIKDARDSARYYAELIGGYVGDELIPLVVPIVKLNKMSDTFIEGFVEFGPGIYGQFFVPPDVKVKTPAEGVEIYNPFQDEESLFAEERFGRKIFYSLLALIIAVSLLIVVFLVLGLLIK